MAKYSNDDAQYARNIVDRLLSDEKTALDIDKDIVISDLENDAADFSSDLELLMHIGADVPAILIAGEHLVPMSLSSFAGLQWFGSPSLTAIVSPHRWHHPFVYEWAHDLFRSLRRGNNLSDGIQTMSLDNARSMFAERASVFLATRIAAVRTFSNQNQRQSATSPLNILQKTGGTRVTTPGCNFRISTNSPGLRVFWSGAYRISPNYFSHPTTPATSVLQSGTYVFGVDGGAYGNSIQWDNSAVISLPGIPYAHLNY
jgi:hypothetical protein